VPFYSDRPNYQPDASNIPPHRHAKAIVLDFVNPVRAGGRLDDGDGQARLDKAGR
jgi:hypothetical protein